MAINDVVQRLPVVERLVAVGYVRPNGAAQPGAHEGLEGGLNTGHYGVGKPLLLTTTCGLVAAGEK